MLTPGCQWGPDNITSDLLLWQATSKVTLIECGHLHVAQMGIFGENTWLDCTQTAPNNGPTIQKAVRKLLPLPFPKHIFFEVNGKFRKRFYRIFHITGLEINSQANCMFIHVACFSSTFINSCVPCGRIRNAQTCDRGKCTLFIIQPWLHWTIRGSSRRFWHGPIKNMFEQGLSRVCFAFLTNYLERYVMHKSHTKRCFDRNNGNLFSICSDQQTFWKATHDVQSLQARVEFHVTFSQRLHTSPVLNVSVNKQKVWVNHYYTEKS